MVYFLQVFLLTSVAWLGNFDGGSVMCAMAPEYEAEALQWETNQAKKLQQSAPVVVDIEILSVDLLPPSLKSRTTEVRVATGIMVEARVLSVERSTSGPSLQEHIVIHYQIWEYGDGATGGMIHNPMILRVGDQVRAYLQAAAQPPIGVLSFEIAAGLLSFEPCPPADQSLFRQFKNWWNS
ncbi:MAG: hypothetical protein OEZ57_06345 [Nitrospirota bacterium]|nr:hypothetical protein [Nitrospirota bacterium]MDH5584991.1 hypothetical protein [Nitrospirota bacterium]MDH5774518.1 hypothetical protein [Nitrospirota bacterium]